MISGYENDISKGQFFKYMVDNDDKYEWNISDDTIIIANCAQQCANNKENKEIIDLINDTNNDNYKCFELLITSNIFDFELNGTIYDCCENGKNSFVKFLISNNVWQNYSGVLINCCKYHQSWKLESLNMLLNDYKHIYQMIMMAYDLNDVQKENNMMLYYLVHGIVLVVVLSCNIKEHKFIVQKKKLIVVVMHRFMNDSDDWSTSIAAPKTFRDRMEYNTIIVKHKDDDSNDGKQEGNSDRYRCLDIFSSDHKLIGFSSYDGYDSLRVATHREVAETNWLQWCVNMCMQSLCQDDDDRKMSDSITSDRWNAQMNYATEIEKKIEENLSLKKEIFTPNEVINQVQKERKEYLKCYSLQLMPNIETIESYFNFLDEEHKNSILNTLRNANINVNTNINSDRKDTVENENENEEDTIATIATAARTTTSQQKNENSNSSNNEDGGSTGFTSAGVSSINVETIDDNEEIEIEKEIANVNNNNNDNSNTNSHYKSGTITSITLNGGAIANMNNNININSNSGNNNNNSHNDGMKENKENENEKNDSNIAICTITIVVLLVIMTIRMIILIIDKVLQLIMKGNYQYQKN